MKKTIIVAILFLTFCVSGFVFGGTVNGGKFTSSKYRGFTITVPDSWKIIDNEDEEPDGSTRPVCEIKRKKSFGNKKPNGKVQAVKGRMNLKKYVRAFVKSLKNSGMKITKQAKMTINGKPAYEVHAVLIIGQISVENKWFFVAGKKYLFMLELSDSNDPDLDAESHAIATSMTYK